MSKYLLVSMLSLFLCSSVMGQQWGKPPQGWDDYVIGLVNDHKPVFEEPMKEALDAGIKLGARYAYINNGVDQTKNSISWLFTQWYNYVEGTPAGMQPSFVIYMLQEEGGVSTLKQNVQNSTYMKNYFNSVKRVAEEAKGRKPIFVLEPDTWGYVLQSDQDAAGKNILSQPANINNLGLPWLNSFDNKIADITSATIKTIREHAPDAYVGVLANFWGVDANGKTGNPVPDGIKGMVYWTEGDVKYSSDKTLEFFKNMLDGKDKGDFIAVEKKGLDAGFYLKETKTDAWYWNDKHMEKYLMWVKNLAVGLDLPVLGWQISIAHMGLPNVPDRYEDTFMPYFFTHTQDFFNTGFIGFLVGEGLPQGTNYSMKDGQGDNGWFFQQLQEFDKKRPYNLDLSQKADKIVKKKDSQVFRGRVHNGVFIISGLPKDNVKNVKIYLYNSIGKRVTVLDGNGKKNIKLPNLASGSYVIKASVNGNEFLFKYTNVEFK